MSTNRSLLLVEDDEDLREVLARRLTRRGFQVAAAADSQAAIEAMEMGAFQVAVVDRTLPGLSGLELIERLKQRNAGLRVIMMSGTSEAVAVEHALENGVCEYLTKPFRLADLEAAIDRVAVAAL